MALPSSGSLRMAQIANEFGYTQGSATKIGDYQHVVGGGNFPQQIGGLNFATIDGSPNTGTGSVPTSGPIRMSNFRGTQLQQVVNFWSSGAGGFRLVAKDRYNANGMIGGNNMVAVVGGYKGRPSNSSGTAVHIHVNQTIGSEANDPDHCALRTGGWDGGTNLFVQVGSSGLIAGAGGRGGNGSTNAGGGGAAGFGSSGLGIQYSGTHVNNLGVISCGFGGGGGGAGAFDYDHKNWRHASGGAGGGGAGVPLGAAGSGGTGGGSNATAMNEGGEGGNGNSNGGESFGGAGGVGGDTERVSTKGVNGFGSETPNQFQGGARGNPGAAIKRGSGVSFGNGEITNAGLIATEGAAVINGNLGENVQ